MKPMPSKPEGVALDFE